jgi:hypothetical protein
MAQAHAPFRVATWDPAPRSVSGASAATTPQHDAAAAVLAGAHAGASALADALASAAERSIGSSGAASGAALPHVAMLGLGPVAAAMAARLASRGFRVVAYDAVPSRGAELEARGVQRARTARHAAEVVMGERWSRRTPHSHNAAPQHAQRGAGGGGYSDEDDDDEDGLLYDASPFGAPAFTSPRRGGAGGGGGARGAPPSLGPPAAAPPPTPPPVLIAAVEDEAALRVLMAGVWAEPRGAGGDALALAVDRRLFLKGAKRRQCARGCRCIPFLAPRFALACLCQRTHASLPLPSAPASHAPLPLCPLDQAPRCCA